jgi:hypothetical protein
MHHLLTALCLWLAAAELAGAEPADAVVRITSHGGSGTVIQVGGGKSLILSCGHLFLDERTDRPDPNALARSLAIDAPSPAPTGQVARVGVRLVDVDFQADLCLIEMGTELPYVCPVAPPGTHASHLLSVGFDLMKLPAVRQPNTPLGTSDGWTWTRERPVPGRSGGALIDLDTGTLVGVCHGYTTELGGGRGMYVPLAAIHAFLNKQGRGRQATPPGATGSGGGWPDAAGGAPLLLPPCLPGST